MITPDYFASVINGYLPEPQASLLNGILFGINLKTSKEFYLELQKVGLVHMVVLSGTNIAILALIIDSLLSGFSKNTRLLITSFLVIIFVIFVSPQAPIVRAALLYIITAVSFIYGFHTFSVYILLLTCTLSLIVYPAWLTSISFQLSYAATLGLILFARRKKTSATDSNIKKFIQWVKEDLHISLAAQVFTVPIIFIYFKQISLISPIANLLTAWIIPPLMIFGFMTAILGKLNYFLGLPSSYICYGMLTYMIWIIHQLSSLPFIFIDFS